jgi:hypothetical protein
MNPTSLPLPLELTQPVLLAGDLDTQLRTALTAGGYDARAQLCSGTHSNARCNTQNRFGLNVDVNADVVVDDIIA